MKFKNVIEYLKHPSNIILFLDRKKIIKLSDEKYLKILFKNVMKYDLNLEDPKTFNEKLQWLKLYDRKEEYTNLVDKYEVKNIVSKLIGQEYIIPTLGIYNDFKDIDFNNLPEKFVIKCTHDSGSTIICNKSQKKDFSIIEKKINNFLKRDYYSLYREWPYKGVKPRIIIEPLLVDKKYDELIDYKVMCFNGKMKYIFTCSNRRKKEGLNVDFYDRNWTRLNIERHYKNSKNSLPKPKNFELMINIAELLSKDKKFLRIDFYEVNYKLYFGEITFYPGSGFEEFNPIEWDYKIGNEINLSN